MLQIVTQFCLLHLTPSHAGCKYFVLSSKVHAENFSRRYICVCITTLLDFSIQVPTPPVHPPTPSPTHPDTHTETKAFLLVTDNRSGLDSPFCVFTQHRKFEFGHRHHRQSKKISNAQELSMQLSQTLSSALAQIKVSNSPLTNHTKKILPQRPPLFFNFCIT